MGVLSYEPALNIHLVFKRKKETELAGFQNDFKKHSIWVCSGDYAIIGENKITLLEPDYMK